MEGNRYRYAWLSVLVGIGALMVIGVVLTSGEDPKLVPDARHPADVFGGIPTTLLVAVPADRMLDAAAPLDAALAAIHGVDDRMSTYREDSELTRLNAAPAGEFVPLSDQTLAVLRAAQEYHLLTDGAFDVTIRPILRIWADAGARGEEATLPTAEDLLAARMSSSWSALELRHNGAIKHSGTLEVDLGGIAKGYAIDLAVAAMKAHGAQHGLVDIGGDIRVFGYAPPGGLPWRIVVQNPFAIPQDPENPTEAELAQPPRFAYLQLHDGAICTSGHYRRFSVIEGQRFSHIVDPRTQMPVSHHPSVTVIAPTAMVADTWATALSVLGPAGLELLASLEGVEAMMIDGSPEGYSVHMTEGFPRYILTEPEAPIHTAPRIIVGREASSAAGVARHP